MDDTHRANLRIAESYDALPYETAADPRLKPRAVLGFGAVFGCPGALADILDLGCGAGVQLAQAGPETTGRLVGADLSRENCRHTEEKLQAFGDRVWIHCGDILDLNPQELGQFDLIYAIGLVYAVPPAVRAHALALIGACLKPGGVALISHYAGALPAARTELHRQLRAAVAADLAPREAIAQARAALAQLPESSRLLQEAARLTASLPDATFFHEVFNPYCEPVPVRELDQALAPSLRFLGHLEAPASGLKPDAQARAKASDDADQTGGSYHYAVFGKGARPPDITAPHLIWTTSLRPAGGGLYKVGNQTIPIVHSPTRAALDAIAARPRPFLEAAGPMEREVTARLFRDLWGQNLVTPLRAV